MKPIEALADCIMRFEGWSAPGTPLGDKDGTTSWRNRNPGNLRKSPYSSGTDAKGYAIFPSFADGWNGLTYDLIAKFTFPNEHKLTGQSTLTDLFDIYAPALDDNNPTQYSKTIAIWMTDIYKIPVLPTTTLDQILKLGA